MVRFYEVIERANADIYAPAGLRILDPRPVAFLFVRSSPPWHDCHG